MKDVTVVLTELIDNKPKTKNILMKFLPRKGDILITDGMCKEVVFVSFDAEDLESETITAFVNCLGFKQEAELSMLAKLKSSDKQGLDWV
ncbi:hypothetical protein BCU43_006990 [Vibrio lentus]|nr:hypothetical protein [Vibrio lentus]PMI52036.1 hypothetical protein BCU43_20320 [Vibrio lentus]